MIFFHGIVLIFSTLIVLNVCMTKRKNDISSKKLSRILSVEDYDDETDKNYSENGPDSAVRRIYSRHHPIVDGLKSPRKIPDSDVKISPGEWLRDVGDRIRTRGGIPHILKVARKYAIDINQPNIEGVHTSFVPKQNYQKDPVLNMMMSYRRKSAENYSNFSDYTSSSSSTEMKNWKDQFQEIWLHKKFEALNGSIPKGDSVNMVAARPWGVKCGDPNQQDMPWGSCMLAAECAPEYRIYRGDMYCGRVTFVCCALELTTYDNYQGFDISLEESSRTTDSDEKRWKALTSKERRKRKEKKEKRKRRRDRKVRAIKAKRSLKKIMREINKILIRAFKNGSRMRHKRTRQLKKFVKNLKKQYKMDKSATQDLHESEMQTISGDLLLKLNQIKSVNSQFMHNTTFRDMLVYGKINPKGARMLLEAYPELEPLLVQRRSMSGNGPGTNHKDDVYLHYDIEYGYLYH